MIKKTLFSVAILLFTVTVTAKTALNDTTNTENLTAYTWEPISDVKKVIQYEKKPLSKRSKEQAELAGEHYSTAVNLMKNKEYIDAIKEFKLAMKRYKRAKLSDDALNYLRTNMALSYSSTGNKEDLAQSKRYLDLITSKIYSDIYWTYNIAVAHHKSGNISEAKSFMISIIRKNEFYFQAYVTLEAIYRDSGNYDEADKVNERMQTAKDKLNKKTQKRKTGPKTRNNNNKKDNICSTEGKEPDINNLKIIKDNDHQMFNKKKVDERSSIQIQDGIKEYNIGVKALSDRDYQTSQTHLKISEKKLKRGKVTQDGLNFSRANLVISFLSTKDKRGAGQAKRYLRYLTPKLYKSREWTYNMAVAYYQFAKTSAPVKKGKRNWEKAKSAEAIQESIKLFQKSIKKDNLYLPAYENLIFIYKEIGEDKKIQKICNSFEKSKRKLMQSLSREDQLAKGGEEHIFRVNLGTFGEFDTPANIFDEEYLITIPITEKETAYLAGLFYSLDEAIAYRNYMKKEGYSDCYTVAFKDGEEFEF